MTLSFFGREIEVTQVHNGYAPFGGVNRDNQTRETLTSIAFHRGKHKTNENDSISDKDK